jgi:hypothetical protein
MEGDRIKNCLLNSFTSQSKYETRATTTEFLFQASWGRLKINHMSQKNRDKTKMKKKGKTMDNKKPNKKEKIQ